MESQPKQIAHVRLKNTRELWDLFHTSLCHRALFLRTASPWPDETRVAVQLFVETLSGPISLLGKVIYQAPAGSPTGQGFGIELDIESAAALEKQLLTLTGNAAPYPLSAQKFGAKGVDAITFEHAEAPAVAEIRTKVLVVDDQPATLEIFRKVLLDYGVEIFEAGDALGALEIIAKQTIGLMIVDYLMPRMDGLQLVTKVHSSNKDMPVIMISGVVKDPAIIENIKNAGIRWFLPKPLRLPDLRAAITEALGR